MQQLHSVKDRRDAIQEGQKSVQLFAIGTYTVIHFVTMVKGHVFHSIHLGVQKQRHVFSA